MTLVGGGVLLIGIAVLILAIFLSHVLNNFAGILGRVDQTVQKLQEQLDDLMEETTNLIRESNYTLADVNEQMAQLSLLFYIVGDVGNATRKFTASLADMTEAMKENSEAAKGVADKNKVGGLYGTFAVGYYWWKKRQEMKNNPDKADS